MLSLHPCSCEMNCYNSSTSNLVTTLGCVFGWFLKRYFFFKHAYLMEMNISKDLVQRWASSMILVNSSSLSPLHPPLILTLTLSLALCVMDTVCYICQNAWCQLLPALGTCGASLYLRETGMSDHLLRELMRVRRAGSRRRPGAAVTWLSVHIQIGTCCNTRTWLLVAPCHKCAMYSSAVFSRGPWLYDCTSRIIFFPLQLKITALNNIILTSAHRCIFKALSHL